jgi:hypothetical protein
MELAARGAAEIAEIGFHSVARWINSYADGAGA